MNINVKARMIDTKLRVALYAMTEFAMSKLVHSKRLRDNVTINIHLKHHCEGGEAMLEDYANPYRPREFKVIIDHHRAELDDYGREREATEWAHEILKTLAHEMVHVKQYLTGELMMRKNGLAWRKSVLTSDSTTYEEYFELPYEIEAYGREKGLLAMFLIRWKEIEEVLEINY